MSVGAPAPDVKRAAPIKVDHITKVYGRGSRRHLVLDDVSLDVAGGEFLCLLGPSGCGKSTLLNIIGGFLAPDAGSVSLADQPVRRPGPDRCMIFQQPALFGWLKAIDNVMFGPRAQHKANDEAKERALALLEVVGLRRVADKYPHQLSGGMRQRLSIARALVNQPQVLLMDEPFAALDAITRGQMQEFLLQLWEQRRMTIVFVTHDVEEATLLADRVVVMAGTGRLDYIRAVDIPRPRDYSLIDSPDYSRVRMEIRSVIEKGVRGVNQRQG